jgi:flagellar protein FlaJ
MKSKITPFVGLIVSVVVLGLLLIFKNSISSSLFYFILIILAVLTVFPFILTVIFKQNRQEEKSNMFLEFLGDIVEGVKSGIPINKTISNLSERDYGALNGNIKKLINQLSLGMPLDAALKTMAKDSKNKTISRSFELISEAQKAGGDINQILKSVLDSVIQTENMKKERKSSISNLVVQGYIIFFIFIVIMLVLQYSILPIAGELSNQGFNDKLVSSVSSNSNVSSGDLSSPMLILLLVQSLFAGLVIGKLSEGRIVNGIKHSFILLAISLLITFGAKLILG